MKGLVIFILIFGLVLLVLAYSGQEPAFVAQLNGGPTRTASLIPAVIATAQYAEAESQATQSAGRGQMAQLDVTGTALAIEREQVDLEIKQAAATQEYFKIQTDEAAIATNAAEIAIAATENAHSTETQQAKFDSGTATQNAIIQNGHATETQTVLIVLQAAAEAEAQRIRDEQATQNMRTWLMRGFWTVIAVSLATIFIWTIIEFRRAIVSRLLAYKQGPRGRGKPIIQVLQDDGATEIIDMGRSAGPALHVPAKGTTELRGVMDDPQLQTYVAVQAALVDMLLALNTRENGFHWPWEKDGQGNSPDRHKSRSAAAAAILQRAAQQQAQLQQAIASQQAGMRYLPPEIVNAQFREAPSDDQAIGNWLDDVQGKLFD